MSKLEQLEQQVSNLPPKELAQFREWFLKLDSCMWDQQIDDDLKARKLDSLIAESRTEFKQGNFQPL